LFVGCKVDNLKLAPSRITSWRSPLSCSANETILNISFNSKYIILIISYNWQSPNCRLEFRTRGMAILGYLPLNDTLCKFSLTSFPMNDGWILGCTTKYRGSWNYSVIDNNMQEREQNTLSATNIVKVEYINYSDRRRMLAVCRNNDDVDKVVGNGQVLILELYNI
jgi:hypothetical protein